MASSATLFNSSGVYWPEAQLLSLFSLFVLEPCLCEDNEAHRRHSIVKCGGFSLILKLLTSWDYNPWLHRSGTEVTSLLPIHLSGSLLEDDTESPECHFTQPISKENKAFNPMANT